MTIWFLRHPEETDLALFAGGELGPLGRWRIEGHLSGCAECREVVSEFFELRSRAMDLGNLPHVDWSAMAAGIHQRLEAARLEPRAAARAWRPVWAAAAAVVVLAVAGLVVSLQPSAAPGPVLDASAGAVEWRMGRDQVLTLMNTSPAESQVSWRISADGASARYVDRETGQITVNHVYAQ